MGLHICNNCNYKMHCDNAFKNNLICSCANERIKSEQQQRFDNTDLKEFAKFVKESK